MRQHLKALAAAALTVAATTWVSVATAANVAAAQL